MFDHILVPLDGSAAAEAALGIAVQLPARHIRLLGIEPDCASLEDQCTGARDRESYLERVASRLRQPGRSVTTLVALGNPAEQITAMARAASLVVMSSHGRGAVGRVLFGSVADAVMRQAPVPVLIVRGEQQPPQAIRRIVVPLDGSSLAEQALDLAADLARAMRLPVHFVRVVDFDQVQASVLAGPRVADACARQQAELARVARAYLARLSHTYQTPDCPVTTEVRIGDPAGELLAVFQPEDLAVLATHARGGIARWLVGSVAEAIVQRSRGPVLLVHASPGVPPARSGTPAPGAGGRS